MFDVPSPLHWFYTLKLWVTSHSLVVSDKDQGTILESVVQPTPRSTSQDPQDHLS